MSGAIVSDILVRRLERAIKKYPPARSPAWLPRRFSQAFVVCVGAGPWIFPRRQSVQKKALDWLGNRDISETERGAEPFPLNWENDVLLSARNICRKEGVTFDETCLRIVQQQAHHREEVFYDLLALGNKRLKTLSLFCRDALQADSFPIDRHVRRILEEFRLPVDEWTMIAISRRVAKENERSFTPSMVAYGFVREHLDRGNPDWTKYVVGGES